MCDFEMETGNKVLNTNGGCRSENYFDADGNPEGGQAFGPGFAVAWQRGPLGRGEDRVDPNGAFVENVIQACIDRLTFYQKSKFACEENAKALEHLHEAKSVLNKRTVDREARGVEGTHEV